MEVYHQGEGLAMQDVEGEEPVMPVYQMEPGALRV
jgi:hypothetical protein